MQTIISYLEKAAELYEDRAVYSSSTQQLSFRQLYDSAKSIASSLIPLTRPEQVIAVIAARNVYTPACYLGVAMSGCFYAPMDPDAPSARLKQILSVINADILIADKEHLGIVDSLGFRGTLILVEDAVKTTIDEKGIHDAMSCITELSPIYVLFTSGSTGIPKGVLTSHHSMLCYLDGLQDVIGLNERDVIGNQAPFDYIAAIRDLYLPLITGATTVMLDPSEFAMPTQLMRRLSDAGVTTLCWSSTGLEIPAKLGVFDENNTSEALSLPPLKRVVYSGSVISNPLLRKWQDAFPETIFINQYGPTEATGSCSYYVIDHPVDNDENISIGRPYKHYQMLLLDDDNKEPKIGETGEICIKGPALAIGYYDAAEQTTASFVDNPLQSHYKERIYRTGDIGRYDSSGNLFFLGRKDRQFKHLGHRIEPEEIEQKSMLVSGLNDCMCVYNNDSKTIFLYYTGTATARDISLSLRTELPSHMVPRKIICLKEMPRLPNGKIDRKAIELLANT